MFLFMVCLAGLRWETGTDWIPYYQDFLTPNVRHDFEIGYVTYVNVLRLFTSNYSIFLLLTTSICLGVVFFTLRKFTENKLIFVMSLLLFYSYYYLGSFLGAERRIFAISIGFLAIYYLMQRDNLKFLLLVLLASLFHISALSLLLLLFINKINKLYILTMLFFIAFFSILMPDVFRTIFIDVSNLIIPFDLFKDKLLFYISNRGDELGILGLIKRLIFVLYFVYICKFIPDQYKNLFELLLKVYILGVFIYAISSVLSPMISVISIYFTIVEIVLIPMSLIVTKVLKRNAYIIIFFSIYLAYQAYSILNSYPDLYYPYISIFSDLTRGVY